MHAVGGIDEIYSLCWLEGLRFSSAEIAGLVLKMPTIPRRYVMFPVSLLDLGSVIVAGLLPAMPWKMLGTVTHLAS